MKTGMAAGPSYKTLKITATQMANNAESTQREFNVFKSTLVKIKCRIPQGYIGYIGSLLFLAA